jgi:hypothetical protein
MSDSTTQALNTADLGRSGFSEHGIGHHGHSEKALSIGGLETVYDALATAIDQAGAEKAQLFLVKLALLNANALADEHLFQQQIEAALKDL